MWSAGTAAVFNLAVAGHGAVQRSLIPALAHVASSVWYDQMRVGHSF